MTAEAAAWHTDLAHQSEALKNWMRFQELVDVVVAAAHTLYYTHNRVGPYDILCVW